MGKTTCAAAAAVDAARRGERVLVLSTDPAHSLGDALDVTLGPSPRPVPGAARLDAAEIDAPAAFRRFLSRRRRTLAAIVERGTYLDREDVDRFVALSLPGVDELIALREVTRLARSGDYTRVVVDTAPTGHTLRLLAMPALLSSVASLLDDLQAKHRFLAQSLGRGAYRPDAGDALARELEDDARALHGLLRDRDRTAFVWVTLAETLAVEETKDGLGALDGQGIAADEVVVNRVTPPPSGPCALCNARRRAEAAALGALRAARPRAVLRTVPALEQEPRGPRALAPVARALRARAAAVKARRPEAAARETTRAAFDAEAAAWLPHLLPPEPRLVLFAGKGGVGKTTCAATTALAVAARDDGRRWLLLSTDPAHSLADVLAAPVGDAPTAIAPGLEAREIDSARALEERRQRYRAAIQDVFRVVGTKGGAGAPFDQRAVEDLIELAPPGIDEILAVLSVIDALFREEGPAVYDGVIVDTAPTGHALRLLAMPDLALQWAQAILAVLLKYREVARLGALAEELVGTSRSLRRLRDLLRDPRRCAVVAVTRPGELPRRETRRLLASLKRSGIPVSAGLVNTMTPPGCARCRRAARRERADVRRLSESLPRRLRLLEAPAVAPPPRGARALSRWARTWNTIGTNA